jgi:ribonuclease P protein component
MKLPRNRRMARSGEFRRVREEGRTAAGRNFVLAALDTGTQAPARFGVITSKRVGNAVTRNRLRRQIRSIWREEGEAIAEGYLVVTIARVRSPSASFSQLRGEWCNLAQRLGVLPKRRISAGSGTPDNENARTP